MSLQLLEFLCLLLVAGDVVLIGAQSGGGDKEVLLELKRFLRANNRFNRGAYDAWPESEPSPCGWSGVVCDPAGRVTSLNLSSSSISGPAFGNFSRLSKLTWLDLSDNSITGELPAADLNQCRGLVYLNISHNLICGPLDLSGLTRLQKLDVSGNRLEGSVAANFPAICADLVVFNVSTNELTGNITALFDGCAKLEYVDLSSNNFTGEVWPGIARFRQFSAAENNLTGSVPSSTFPADGCKLRSLDLSANQLLGNLTDSVAKCANLTYLSLWGNNFTGMIPAGIGELAVLETLILGKNRFNRKVPPELTNCSSLQFLDISNNAFGGDVQEIFGKFVSLRYLVLHHNNYTGGIITSGVLRLPQLARLDLSFNELSGELPPQVADMKNLKFLMLAENNFSGGIPPAYGRLAELQALDLSNNKLSRGIPASIGNLTSLLWLMLNGNQLSGEIPPEIGNCTSLLWLNLVDNRLTGKIPPEMAHIGRNPSPTFAKNRDDSHVLARSGECQAMKRWIPASYPPFSFVYAVMTREKCRRTWDRILKGYGIVPICTNSSSPVRSNTISGYVQLSGNLLSGEIPSQIGAMRNLSLLHLDGNRLTGRLPPEIGQLPLVVLNVSRNTISGPIPSEIGHILCLQIMDLSYNNFSGELPLSLSQLTALTKFNVSYNPLLSGNVPTTSQFGTFDEQSFLGDPHITWHQSRAAGKQPPPEAADVAAVRRRRMSPRTITVWFFFSLIIAGIVVFIMANLRARFPVDQDPDPESFSCENPKCGGNGKCASQMSTSSPPSGSSAATGCSSTEGVKVFRLDKTAFTYRDIVAATGNFSDDRVIGRGGYGVVYRGVLPDGRAVAVKKLTRLRDGGDSDAGSGGEREFRAEMEVLADRMGSTWPHPNLVTLYGWCLSGSAKVLVYEYLEGGNLEALIGDRAAFGWGRRLDAAIGVARALVCLHHECRPAVVHRDVKASNVLLDRDGQVKVTDFGLARVVCPGDTHVSTMVAGTVGYVAPEYGQTWRATTKGDVYSYGVLLMELATGRRAVDSGEEECLIEWGRRMAKEGWKVRQQPEERNVVFWELFMLGMRCTADTPQERPDMPDVLAALLDIAENGDASCRYCKSSSGRSHGGYNLMSCIREIPTLKGDNYGEWKKKIDLAFILAEVDWVLTTARPTEPLAPVREQNEDDTAWQNRQRDHAPLQMSYDLDHKKWTTANKKCMAVIKNTIEPAILGSIAECDTVTEYLDKIKSQFTGSSKTYATQLIKQLVTERYSGGGNGIREHILRMSNLASKLKPMDLALKDEFLIHLVFASLPKEFDTFVVNYNMQPEKWDMEKCIAMCVQEEERIKTSHGGSINFVRENKKKNYNSNSFSKNKGKAPVHQPQQNKFAVDKDQCLHCKKTGHYKKDCPDYLKMIMAKKGIPFDEDYAKKRKMR